MSRFWPLAVAACLAGCGSGNGLSLGKVQGKVTFKGQPIMGGTVLFEPDSSKGTTGPPAVGSISKDGSFTLSTEESGDGAIVGYHRVAITGIDPKPMAKGDEDLAKITGQEFMARKAQHGKKEAPKKTDGPVVRARDGSVYRVITPEKLLSPKTSDVVVKVNGSLNTKTIAIDENGTVAIE